MFTGYHGTPAGYGGANSILGNPNMSAANGNLYLDTVQGYLNPRMYLTLGLGTALSVNELVAQTTEIYPNPANNVLNIISYTVGINSISIFNLNGQEVLNTTVNANQIRINTSSLANGVYIVDIKSNNTSVKRKLVIE
jgi:aminopeptidase YwaD